MTERKCRTYLVDESGGAVDSDYITSIIEQLLDDNSQLTNSSQAIVVFDNCS